MRVSRSKDGRTMRIHTDAYLERGTDPPWVVETMAPEVPEDGLEACPYWVNY